MHSWCSSYLEKRPLGKFGRDETKFKLPLHHLFLILQVHIILGAVLDLKWGGLGDLCTWGKNKESELPPNFIIDFTHWRCQSLENFEGFQLFLFYFKESSQGSRQKTNILRSGWPPPPLRSAFREFFGCVKNPGVFFVHKHFLSPF